MKGSILVLLFIASFTGLSGQSLDKTYFGKSKDEFIKFSNENRISFSICDVGGFGEFYYSGEGTYKFKNGVIKIKVLSHDQSLESSYKTLKDSSINSGFIIKGQVISEDSQVLPGVTFSYKVGKRVTGFISDRQGYFFKKIETQGISEIDASLVGYRVCKIPVKYNTLIDCQIMMKVPYYKFLDNRTLKANLTLDDKTQNFSVDQIKIK